MPANMCVWELVDRDVQGRGVEGGSGRLHRCPPPPPPPPPPHSQTEIMGELIAALETAEAPSTDMDR